MAFISCMKSGCTETFATVAESMTHEHMKSAYAERDPQYYCPCGCAQPVSREGEYASDECESEPYAPFPFPYDAPQKRQQSWEEYLDECRGSRSPDESCERGTVGCSVRHFGEESCETW